MFLEKASVQETHSHAFLAFYTHLQDRSWELHPVGYPKIKSMTGFFCAIFSDFACFSGKTRADP